MKKSKLDKLTEALAEAGYEMRQFKAYSEGRSIDLTIDLIEAQDDSNGLKPQKRLPVRRWGACLPLLLFYIDFSTGNRIILNTVRFIHIFQ